MWESRNTNQECEANLFRLALAILILDVESVLADSSEK